jgi:hypothetical protein
LGGNVGAPQVRGSVRAKKTKVARLGLMHRFSNERLQYARPLLAVLLARCSPTTPWID